MDDDVVRRPILKAVHANELELVFDVSEPETTGIEEMRAEVGQHAGTLIAPRGIAHEPRGAVTVEHATGIDRTELTAGDEIAHPHEMRLETVIVSGIANDAVPARERLQSGNFAFMLRPQRLLDQHVLAIADAVVEDLDLGLVGNAGQDRVIIRERNVHDRPVAGVLIDRVDGCDKVGAGDPTTLMPLNSEARDHDPHRWKAQAGAICRSMASIFARRSSAVTGMLPSHSHSTAAAIVPRIVAMPGSRTDSIASVA